MSRVSDILSRKSSEVHSIDEGATVLDAIRAMVEANVGSVVVTRGDEIRGIFTERDYLRRIVLQGRTSDHTVIGEVMTRKLICVEPSLEVDECMDIMTQERIRHLPVMDGKRLVGIVSIGDLVKHLSSQRAREIRYLTDYITGKYPG